MVIVIVMVMGMGNDVRVRDELLSIQRIIVLAVVENNIGTTKYNIEIKAETVTKVDFGEKTGGALR